MSEAMLEHVNVTVADSVATAERLVKLFGWKIRWQGPAKNNGHTVHVGGDDSYIALYSLGTPQQADRQSYDTLNGLNHVGIVVDELDAVEKKVIAMGYTTGNHADYEPGRRFYFSDEDGVEFEIISYT